MRQIRIEKNSAKCVKFVCKNHCEILHFSANFAADFAVFLAHKYGAFFSVFRRKIDGKLYGNFVYFSSFFVMIFYGSVRRDGKGGIPVKSR